MGGYGLPDGGKHAVPIDALIDIVRDENRGLILDRIDNHKRFSAVIACRKRGNRGHQQQHETEHTA